MFVSFIDVKSNDIRHEEILTEKHRSSRVSIIHF